MIDDLREYTAFQHRMQERVETKRDLCCGGIVYEMQQLLEPFLYGLAKTIIDLKMTEMSEEEKATFDRPIKKWRY